MSLLRVARPCARLFSSLKPPQPPKPIDDSTSALDYKRSQRIRPPPLPATDLPRPRTAEEAVTNILYNTPPPSLQPFKKYPTSSSFQSLLVHFFCFAPDIFSTVSYKMNLVFSPACQEFLLEEVSILIPWSCAAPRYAT